MIHLHSVNPAKLRRSGLTLSMALVIIAVLAIFFTKEVIELQSTLADVRHNDEARIQVRNVLVDLLDAETGQRGFLLTGEENYLEPFHHGRARVLESIRRTRDPSFMSQELVPDAPQILLLAQQKLEELERTITLRRKGKSEQALAIVKNGSGKATMDKAGGLIQDDLTRLRKLRDVQIAELDNRLRASAIFLILMLTSVVILALTAWRSLHVSARSNNDLAKKLAQEASHDLLTGLPNRRFFEHWAKHLVSKSKRESTSFSLMLIDLDGFKKVNDSLGHALGDEVLKAATARLQATLRGGELLARIGGDEFALLIEGNLTRHQLASLGERMIASLQPALHKSLSDGAVGTSIGVAVYPQNGSDIETLTEVADSALYQSKENGKGRVSFRQGRLMPELDGDEIGAAVTS